jgi:hypothetical protein
MINAFARVPVLALALWRHNSMVILQKLEFVLAIPLLACQIPLYNSMRQLALIET